MTVLFKRVADVVEYGEFAGDLVTNENRINAVLNSIRKEPEYKQYYINWKTQPNQMYAMGDLSESFMMSMRESSLTSPLICASHLMLK